MGSECGEEVGDDGDAGSMPGGVEAAGIRDGVRRHRELRASGASIAPDRTRVGGRVEAAGDGGIAPGGVGDEAPAPDLERGEAEGEWGRATWGSGVGD